MSLELVPKSEIPNNIAAFPGRVTHQGDRGGKVIKYLPGMSYIDYIACREMQAQPWYIRILGTKRRARRAYQVAQQMMNARWDYV